MKYKLPSIDSFNKESIKLDWNEGSKSIIKSLDFVDLERLKNYPILESNNLKKSLLDRNDFNNSDIDIILTSGSDEFSFRLLLALKDKIDCLYFINPSYTQIKSDCSLIGIEVFDLFANPFDDYTIELFKNIDPRTKGLFYLCSPNNPTGKVIKQDLIITLIKKFPKSIFLIDEAYMDFCQHLSSINLIEDYSNLIFVKTFSKAYSLAGLRVGYGIYNRNKFPFLESYFNPKSISLLSTVICKRVLDLNLSNNYLKDVQKFKQLLNELNNPNVIYNHGNFFLYKPISELKQYIKKLNSKNIYVRDRSDMYGLEGYVRISIVDYNIMIENLDLLFEKT